MSFTRGYCRAQELLWRDKSLRAALCGAIFRIAPVYALPSE